MFKDINRIVIERSKENNVEVVEDKIYNFGTFIDGTCIKKPELKNECRNRLGIIHKADVNTSNTFLNVSQNIVKKKDMEEERRIANADISFPYKKIEVLTNAEKQLYHFMSNNLCQINRIKILPKVRLADIITLDERISLDRDYLWQITNKHVDYLICDGNTFETICVVELDDYTHDTEKALERDNFVMGALQACGIKTYRIKSAIRVVNKDDFEEVEEHLNRFYSPKCPECGEEMVPKKDCKSNLRYYECIDCTERIPIDTCGEKLP